MPRRWWACSGPRCLTGSLRRLAAALTALVLWAAAAAAEQASVAQVVDGDTVRLSDSRRVRLIGVNAPEYEPWKPRIDRYGKEAAQYLRSKLEGRTVRLEYDRERFDRYGRTLAYLYDERENSVNLDLVEQGYARAMFVAPNDAHYREYKQAQERAKKARRGMWAA